MTIIISAYGQNKIERINAELMFTHNRILKNQTENETLKTKGSSTKQRLDSVVSAGSSKSEYTYDANGNIIQQIEYKWEFVPGTWEVYRKHEYIYDVNGSISQEFDYEWISGINRWDTSKVECIYDIDGKVSQEFFYNKNTSTNNWDVYWKIENTYNINGYIEENIGYSWNSSKNSWEVYTKTTYIYNASQKMTNIYQYSWDRDKNNWKEHDSKYEYIYGVNKIMVILYDWDSYLNKWDSYLKTECTYDNTYTSDELVLPFFEDFEYKFLYGFEYEFDEYIEEWVVNTEFVFYYSEIASSVQFVELDKVSICPNPTSDYLKFNIRKNQNFIIEIIDIQGKKLMHCEINNGETICVGHLNSGLYIYNIFSEELKQSGKFIKK